MHSCGVHLFGSRRGYRTLARSADVTAAEDAALSGIGFGQVTDARAIAMLATRVTAVGRPLPGGRFAITRALPGGADDAGRPTLALCTLLIGPRAYCDRARYALAPLLGDRSLWDLRRFESGAAIELPVASPRARQANRRDLAVADAWLLALEADAVAVLPPGSETAILALPEVLASVDAMRFRWGVNVIGLDAGADVVTAAPEGGGGRRGVIECSLDGPLVSDWMRFQIEQGTVRTPLVLRDVALAMPESGARGAAVERRRGAGRGVRIAVLVPILLVALLMVVLVGALAVRGAARNSATRGAEATDGIAALRPDGEGSGAGRAPRDGAASAASSAAGEKGLGDRAVAATGAATTAAGPAILGPESPVTKSAPPEGGASDESEVAAAQAGPPATASGGVADSGDRPAGAGASGDKGSSGPGQSKGAERRDDALPPGATGAGSGAPSAPPAPPDAAEPASNEPAASSEADEPAAILRPTRPDELLKAIADASDERTRRALIIVDEVLAGAMRRLEGDLKAIAANPLLSLGDSRPPVSQEREELRSIHQRTERRAKIVAAVESEYLELVRGAARSGTAGAKPDADVHRAGLAKRLRLARGTGDRGDWNSIERVNATISALAIASDLGASIISARDHINRIDSGLLAIRDFDQRRVDLPPLRPADHQSIRRAIKEFGDDLARWSQRSRQLQTGQSPSPPPTQER
ncbi:MAG TPA: hypothetical protein PKC43_11235 [Phycisphaerales bacterium]|nr:hypothetical protein [Phycisphaerales bacterium]HMP38006.1 hypothetical protein [Phycisphaerales bacterium]